MSKFESAPMLKLAWVPLFSGMTVVSTRTSTTHSNVIPAPAGTHASLRLLSLEGEAL
jgi:hypothetical protein